MVAAWNQYNLDLKDHPINRIISSVILNSLKASFLISVYKLLLKRQYHTGLIKSVNKRLNRIYLETEGLKNSLSEAYSLGSLNIDTSEKFESISKVIEEYNDLYFSLQKVDFFRNSLTRELSEGLIDNLYSIQGYYRLNANFDSSINDSSLLEFSSKVTQNSFSFE